MGQRHGDKLLALAGVGKGLERQHQAPRAGHEGQGLGRGEHDLHAIPAQQEIDIGVDPAQAVRIGAEQHRARRAIDIDHVAGKPG